MNANVSSAECTGPLARLFDVHWAIAAGESGNGHRPIDLDWVRELCDQCLDRGVAFWFKQRDDLLDGHRRKQHYEGMSP